MGRCRARGDALRGSVRAQAGRRRRDALRVPPPGGEPASGDDLRHRDRREGHRKHHGDAGANSLGRGGRQSQRLEPGRLFVPKALQPQRERGVDEAGQRIAGEDQRPAGLRGRRALHPRRGGLRGARRDARLQGDAGSGARRKPRDGRVQDAGFFDRLLHRQFLRRCRRAMPHDGEDAGRLRLHGGNADVCIGRDA